MYLRPDVFIKLDDTHCIVRAENNTYYRMGTIEFLKLRDYPSAYHVIKIWNDYRDINSAVSSEIISKGIVNYSMVDELL